MGHAAGSCGARGTFDAAIVGQQVVGDGGVVNFPEEGELGGAGSCTAEQISDSPPRQMMRTVVDQVASLTKAAQVAQPIVGRIMIQMRGGKHNHGKAASPGFDRNIGTTEGKTSALQRNDSDIEDTVWRNIDGLWAKLRYRSVVNREVAKCCGGKKFGRIKYTGSIVVIGDPEDSRLIAPQLHLMWLESLPGDVDLE